MVLRIINIFARRKGLFTAPSQSLGCIANPFLNLGSANAPEASCYTCQRGYASDGASASAKKESTLMVLNVEGKRNTSPVLLGLMDYFERFVPRVGFFQPIAGESFPSSNTKLPRHVELLHSYFEMAGDPRKMFALGRQEVTDLLSGGHQDEMFDKLYAAFQEYSSHFDMVIVEGSHEDGPINLPANRLALNSRFSQMLGAPMLMILDCKADLSSEELYRKAMIARNDAETNGAEVLGLILNKVPPESRTMLKRHLGARLEAEGLPLLGAIPFDPLLTSIRLDEIRACLGAEIIFGQNMIDIEVDQTVVACSHLEEFLEQVEAAEGSRPLVITDMSRPDVILGLMAAGMSGVGPYAAGVLLTEAQTRRKLGRIIRQILESKPPMLSREDSAALEPFRLPVLATHLSVWEIAQRLTGLQASILPTSLRKIEESRTLFIEHVDANRLAERLQAEREMVMTPKMFAYNINRKCLANPQRIVLPEALDPRVLHAAADVTRRKLARIILLGNEAAIRSEALRLNVDLSGCSIVDPSDRMYLDRYIPLLVEARKKKALTPEMAEDLLMDVNYFGTLMTLAGDADGMVSGAIHTTASTIRPGLQVLRGKEMPLVSSVFLMCLPDKVLAYADCAVNVHPSSDELAHIAIASADTAAAFGIDPKVALLSYSTLGSGSGPEVDTVIEAVKIAKALRPDLKFEGPIQYDAAVDPDVARVKIKTPSEVAGKATVCIFPDLNTGNNTYKAVQQSTGAIAIGPLMQGLSKPVNDLSRGCTIQDITNTIRCTSVQAMAVKDPSATAAAAAA